MMSIVEPPADNTGDKNDWFKTWFDSPYYHILYKDRDDIEAEHFLDNLIDFIKPQPNARILDVACGKGRHSIYLNKKGFDVTGFDLSEESIQYDKQFENDKLKFFLHDMREVFRTNYFDIILNLFSSFGYFEKEHDNVKCIVANATALKIKGIFVFDYFNAAKIRKVDDSEEVKIVDGIDFHITKYIDGNYIIKKITFTDKGTKHEFEEKLLLAGKKEMEKYFVTAGLEITNCFGNYKFDAFDENESDRLILIAKKIKI